METVFREPDTQRSSERRTAPAASITVERRLAERRFEMERRQDGLWLAFMQRLLDPLTASGRGRQVHAPRRALLIIFALAFLYLMVNFDSSLSTASKTPPPYEASEVIVFDASEAMSAEIARSGYAVIETMHMGGLNTRVLLLKIPQGMSVPDALTDLQNRYPGLEINANEQIISIDPS